MSTITLKKLPHSEVELTGTLSVEELAPHRKKALEKLNNEVELKGFRKGHVPESVLVKTVGDMRIWEETFFEALSEAYPKFLMEHKLPAIGRPQVAIKKIAPNAPVEFTLTTAVIPEINVGDYKKIREEESKKPATPDVVTDKDVEDVLANIKKEQKETDPPIDDEEKLKTRIRESLTREKEIAANQKKRARVVEQVVKETQTELPRLLVDEELNRMEARVKHDLERMGVTLDKYLGEIKKTMEEMRAEWKPQAEKNVKIQMALAHIAEKEKLAPQKELLDREASALAKAHNVSEDKARAYVAEILQNELVLSYLEGK